MTMHRLTDRFRSFDSQAGMTIIEVVVGAMILALGAAATFGVLTSASKNAQRAKATQVALNRAQLEMETLRSLSNSQLAMTDVPNQSANPLSPNYRVLNGTFALVRNPVGTYANMVVNGGSLYGGGFIQGGIVAPGPTPFTSGDVSGKIFRYVVWRDDVNCPAATCPGTQDYKEIVVAVKLDKASNQTGERGYVEVTSDFIDPTDSALSDPVPGASGVVTAQQFYLSGTSCSSTPPTVRQEIAGNHLLHNTLGRCSDGPKTGSTKGAPDSLLLGPPPDPDYLDPLNPVEYDYADDFYLEPTPDNDKGLQILRDDSVGCNYEPKGTTNKEAKVHRWLTDPMTTAFKMTGKFTLEFFTRTITSAGYAGQLCVYLFRRSENASSFTDTFLTDKAKGFTYWSYIPAGGTWPSVKWKQVRLPLEFNSSPYTIAAGERLGLALSVERAGTFGDALAIMYDHPELPSRLEIDTTTPIDGG
ncbi:MAG TPA: type II secretion system protein [Solirubrobacterales bacterium]